MILDHYPEVLEEEAFREEVPRVLHLLAKQTWNLQEALRQLACAAGINHQEWFNIGSSWYGDGRRVHNLAKLTVALNKFGR